MSEVMGVINLAEPMDNMQYLTEHRPLGAVPFGGRYRLVDFTLSNMINAGIQNVGIFVQDRYRALMDHLGSGKDWGLDRLRDGLFILPPDGHHHSLNPGDIELLHRHLDYFEKSRQDTVVMTGTSMICNLDFKEVLAYHKEKDAEITIVYKTGVPGPYEGLCTLLDLTSDQRVTGIEVDPVIPRSRNLSMQMYIMDKGLLMELLDQSVSRGETDWVKDCLNRNLGQLRVFGYPFKGYLGKIASLQSYYRTTMELLHPTISRELFFHAGLIYTKVKNEPPTKYHESANVKTSLIANGCVVEGTVENSVLFRGVKVGKGAHVKNSVLMQRSIIGENCQFEHVILDKDVLVSSGKHLMGAPEYPLVIRKKTVLS
ncbi:MAG: glucose-1-phosphate adenylyltransferase subunit GlgD [Firmicutes bacterium]|nr:glucose-1-phosphate adenylyltransferase subunit GlgD [Bacillota bacterium]